MFTRITAVLIFIAFRPVLSFSQTVISIGGSSNLYVSTGNIVSLDSLVLTPTVSYNITGPNVLTHNSTLIHPSVNPSINRAYYFTSALSSYSGSIYIYYLSSELNSLSPSTLEVNTYNSGWSHYSSANAANFCGAGNFNNASFSELSLAAAAAPLPILWLSESAVLRNNLTYVQWSTADESNCKNYQVQKSLNGTDWSDPAPPLAARNTAGPNQYNWTDPSPVAGVVYYRIRESDYDGVYSYSTVMVVGATGGNQNAVTVYPNPVTNLLTVTAAVNGSTLKSVRIYDAEGRTVLTAIGDGSWQYQTDVSRLVKGIYTLIVSFSDGSSVAQTFIKQ